MTDLLTTAGRLAYGLAGLIAFEVWRRRRSSGRWLLPAGWVASRLGAALLLFGLLRLPAPTDATSTYIEQARGALAGLLPYRDFESSFAPLFPSVLGLMAAGWNSPLVFVAGALALEGALLALWAWFGPKITSRETTTLALATYLCSTLPFNTAIMGQDEIGVACVLTLIVILLHYARTLPAAVIGGVMMTITKFTSLLYLPFLAWRSRSPWRFGGIVGLVALPVYAFFQLAGADVLAPVKFESGLYTNGNLFFLLSYLGHDWVEGVLLGRVAFVILFSTLAAIFFRYWFRRAPDTWNVLEGIVIAQLAFLLLFKKSYHTYLAMIMPLLCLLLAERRPAWLRALLWLTLLSALQQSLFFRVMSFSDLAAWHWSTANGLQRLFVLTDVVMVGGYVWLTLDLLRLPARGHRPGEAAGGTLSA